MVGRVQLPDLAAQAASYSKRGRSGCEGESASTSVSLMVISVVLYGISNDISLMGDANRERRIRQSFADSFGKKF